MRKNYANDLNVDSISNHFGFSKYYFCHIFKEITGITIVKCSIIYVVKKQKECLKVIISTFPKLL